MKRIVSILLLSMLAMSVVHAATGGTITFSGTIIDNTPHTVVTTQTLQGVQTDTMLTYYVTNGGTTVTIVTYN